MTDCREDIAAAVIEAAAQQQALYINGGGSKRHLLGRECEARLLDVSGHKGITDYQPSELVVTARAGTSVADIEAELDREQQSLPFEPPQLGGRATLGGTIACNLSGPARPWAGSGRDLVLGVQLIDGLGQQLNFGGKVMKNVAGYDVSRLQAGALGTLGILTEVSLKVMPKPEHSLTLLYEMGANEAVEYMNRRAGEAAPLSGACWLDGTLYLRLSGTGDAVDHKAAAWGGQRMSGGTAFWRELRELTLPFFDGPEPLWRMSIRSTAAAGKHPAPMLIDWGGAQRWLRGEFELDALQREAADAGGNVTLVRGGKPGAELRARPDTVTVRLQQRLKQTFDPKGILNPGRLYGWL